MLLGHSVLGFIARGVIQLFLVSHGWQCDGALNDQEDLYSWGGKWRWGRDMSSDIAPICLFETFWKSPDSLKPSSMTTEGLLRGTVHFGARRRWMNCRRQLLQLERQCLIQYMPTTANSAFECPSCNASLALL